ncbi:MAG: hypothetical protein ACM3VT_19870 [Solirubrobacterales bacterium]
MNQDTSDIKHKQRWAIITEAELPVSERHVSSAGRTQPVNPKRPAPRATLPFTTLEEWLFWEDRPAYPWCCFARLRFTGQLDRAAFEAAVCKVLRRHPLLSAKVRMRARRHLEWILEKDPRPIISWRSGPLGGPFPPATSIDLSREIGIRFNIISDGRACDLIIQWHHACCDGVGIVAFADELLIAYTLALGSAPDGLQLPPLEPERLASRNKFGLTPGKLIRMLPGHLMNLPGVAGFLLREPAPLIPHEPSADEGPPPPGYPMSLTGIVDRADLLCLREIATQHGVRLNDLMVRELFLALAQWRAKWNIPDDDWLRLMIPVNLRIPGDRLLPAASLASFVCVDGRRQDCADPERLLGRIHNRMSAVLEQRLGLAFVFSCRMVNLIPGRLRAHIRKPRCLVSCVLTNLGRTLIDSPLPRRDGRLVAGNVTLEAIDCVAPNHPYTCATFAAVTYADRLFITLHYDPRPLTGPQAADLLDTFLTRLRTVQPHETCPAGTS